MTKAHVEVYRDGKLFAQGVISNDTSMKDWHVRVDPEPQSGMDTRYNQVSLHHGGDRFDPVNLFMPDDTGKFQWMRRLINPGDTFTGSVPDFPDVTVRVIHDPETTLFQDLKSLFRMKNG